MSASTRDLHSRTIRPALHRGQALAILSGVLLAVASVACGPHTPAGLSQLHPCAGDEGPADASCGSLSVFEDRHARNGRRITLAIVVLPALSDDYRADPLVFLAGGPGQGAARLAPLVQRAFSRVQRHRDIVLVDQRGTGRSHPLNCPENQESLQAVFEDDAAAVARLRKCLQTFDADVRLYTTPIAMDDLDDVLMFLGYGRVNLYGGSYGTRAALVYLRQHPSRVRSIVLDGVAPMDMRLPLFAARDAGRALDKLLADCERQPSCGHAYPALRSQVAALLGRLERAPARVTVAHPRSGTSETVDMTARAVSNALLAALYSPTTATMVPMLVERASRDDFQALLALGFASDVEETMSVGMQLSVLCSEDAGQITPADVAQATTGSVFGRHLMAGQLAACAMWPKGMVPPDYFAPVVSDVPALVLSGDLDPVTPPSWGEAVARHLRNSQHLVASATGHGVATTPCGARVIGDFLERATVNGLDAGCLGQSRRPPFFLQPSGPDPSEGVHLPQ